jgi:ACT domain-containing protein
LDWPAAHRFVAELSPSPGARRDLLRVLTSSSEVRADVIRQFHERGKDVMAEVLVLLEENDAARQAVIEELSARP